MHGKYVLVSRDWELVSSCFADRLVSFDPKLSHKATFDERSIALVGYNSRGLRAMPLQIALQSHPYAFLSCQPQITSSGRWMSVAVF